MANHALPVLTSTYTNYTSELDARFDDLAVGLDPAVTTATNLPTNSLRWASASSTWQKYNGSTWVDWTTVLNIPALNASGNVTLGSTATNSTTVSGYVGIGGSASSTSGISINSNSLTGTTQIGINNQPTATSAATTAIWSNYSAVKTAAAVYTVASSAAYYAANATKGVGSGITNLHGIYIEDQTQGSNNYGITSLVTSGANKWNIYASGTANNTFAGNTRIGSTVAPTVALDVTGSATVSGTITATTQFSGPGTGITGTASSLTAGKASSIVGGATGNLLYQTASDATGSIPDVATGNVLLSGGVGVAPAYGKVGLTTHVSGTLPATNGGTGQTAYAIGDLLYAPTTTTVGKIADVATGNVLLSGGVGVAPAYGKVDLTTHVSGTLPVANGGTGGTLPATNGGTGQTAYAIGDLLYAPTTTTVGKIADVATGNVLLSGGVGVAPAYGKVGLTTHVSGTLPVANGGTGATTITGVAYGNGTGAFTSATSSQIVTAIGSTAVTNATNATTIIGGSVGAVLYQSAVGITSALADVATGSVLLSGGVGVAPAYGKVGLTTHISGTLPLANGGTGSTTQIAALQALGVIAGKTVNKTAAYTVISTDRGVVLMCSGTWTLSLTAAATLANGFSFGVINSGTGIITIDPVSAELIDDLASKDITKGQSCILVTDGTSWKTLGLSGGGAVDDVFYENSTTVTSNYSIKSGKNAMSAGPITINTGITVTIPTGSVWSIVG